MAVQFTYPVRVLRQHTVALEAALSVCLADPGLKAVHRLRTETRRLEAQLLLLASLPAAPEHREAAAAFERELRRLRRAAGEVRDLDVHRKHLEALSIQAAAAPPAAASQTGTGALAPTEAQATEPNPAGRKPAAAQVLETGGASLREHLNRKREKAAIQLQRLLAKRQTRAALAAETLVKALRGGGHLRLSAEELTKYAATVLHRDNLLEELRVRRLNEEELHAIRKSAKAARYLAETLPRNRLAEAAAERFEALQEAGGLWHDVVEITRAARKNLGRTHALTISFAAERDLFLESYLEKLQALRRESGASPTRRAAAKRTRAGARGGSQAAGVPGRRLG